MITKSVDLDLPALCSVYVLLKNKLEICKLCKDCNSKVYHRDVLERALLSFEKVM